MATSLADRDRPEGSQPNGTDSLLDTVEDDKERREYEAITRESSASTEELGVEESSGPPRPTGFWHHSMVNVRLHVIKLWARTGMK